MRVVGPELDYGAFERPADDCAADVNNNGIVNVDDLLVVLNGWGACSGACPADVTPAPCGDGDVNVDDLVVIINAWGLECATGDFEDVGSLSSVQDCMDRASQSYTPYSPQWDTAVQRCVDALCAAQIISCD